MHHSFLRDGPLFIALTTLEARKQMARLLIHRAAKHDNQMLLKAISTYETLRSIVPQEVFIPKLQHSTWACSLAACWNASPFVHPLGLPDVCMFPTTQYTIPLKHMFIPAQPSWFSSTVIMVLQHNHHGFPAQPSRPPAVFFPFIFYTLWKFTGAHRQSAGISLSVLGVTKQPPCGLCRKQRRS